MSVGKQRFVSGATCWRPLPAEPGRPPLVAALLLVAVAGGLLILVFLCCCWFSSLLDSPRKRASAALDACANYIQFGAVISALLIGSIQCGLVVQGVHKVCSMKNPRRAGYLQRAGISRLGWVFDQRDPGGRMAAVCFSSMSCSGWRAGHAGG